ncbi:hypothetical protein [Bacillus altitudinis]|nr:hypothetical protein [Bacillus altitudinis]
MKFWHGRKFNIIRSKKDEYALSETDQQATMALYTELFATK